MLRTLAIGIAIALVVFALSGGHVFFLPLLFIPLGLFSIGTERTAAAAGGGSTEAAPRSGVCESRWVGPSGAVARVVSSVLFVTHLASGRVRAFAMNRLSVHGDAGLSPLLA